MNQGNAGRIARQGAAGGTGVIGTVGGLREDKQVFQGVAALVGVEIKLAKNGSHYASGEMCDTTGSRYFKMFFKSFGGERLDDGVYQVSGIFEQWNGSWSVRVTSLAPRPDLDVDDYRKRRYGDGSDLARQADGFLKSRLDDRGRALVYLMLHGDGEAVPDISEAFARETAAVRHHDATPNGLLAHSLKTARIADGIMGEALYRWTETRVDRTLVVAGAYLHDIGKVAEYSHGSMSDEGRMLMHTTIGVMRAQALHGKLVQVLGMVLDDDGRPKADADRHITVDRGRGEESFERLVAILAQHHDEYGERARCMEARLVHLADTLEAQCESVCEAFGPDAQWQGEGVVSRPVEGQWLA